MSFATISATFIETVILYAHGALVNQLNLVWWVWIKNMQLCICKLVRSIHTHRFMPFATISETFIELGILCPWCINQSIKFGLVVVD